jgi:hypothetical protein
MNTKKDPIKEEEGGNSKNNWENKTSVDKEPSWYANIEQPIKFDKHSPEALVLKPHK